MMLWAVNFTKTSLDAERLELHGDRLLERESSGAETFSVPTPPVEVPSADQRESR